LHLRFVRYRPEARAVAGRVVVPQRVTSRKPELKSAQRRALVALEAEPGASLTRTEYERLTGVGRSQAAYDLAELVSAGLLVRVGGGRATRYLLAHEPASKRHWTPDRIRHELRAFCAGRSEWPTANEFKRAGHGDLYVAASRYGGIAHWAEELGLERVDHSRAAAPATHAPLRARLAWGVAGALAAGSLAAAAVAAVVATPHFGPSPKGGTGETAGLQASPWIVHPWLHTARATASPTPPRHFHAVTRAHVTRPTTRPSGTQASLAQQRTLVSEPRTLVSEPVQTGPAGSSSDSPAPLPAPAGASAPSPLQAPGR
jgi:hypothetical protein